MTLRYLIFILFLLLQANVTAQTLNIQPPDLVETQIPNPPTLADKRFGTALALSGSTLAISANVDDTSRTGSVYIYDEKGSWQLTAELNSQHKADNFAGRIVLVDNRLIVSADHDDSLGKDSGAVYVFERNLTVSPQLWQQRAKITAPDGQAGDRFGQGISLVEDKLYIGAPYHNQGKVYIYSLKTGSNEWQFLNSVDPVDNQAQHFGAAIAQDLNTLIIGAPYTDADNSEIPASRITLGNKKNNSRFSISKGDTFDPGIQSGAIFVYELVKGIWQYTTRIGASNRETGDHLGEQITINGNTIVASLKQKDVWDELRAGSVYTYKKIANSWQEDTALTAEPPQFGGTFGTSFSMLNNHVLVGANKMHSNGFNSGKVYLFNQKENKSWQLIHQQTNFSVSAHDQFGLSVALGNDKIRVASKNAVYSFQNTNMSYYPAIYYPEYQALQLDEVVVTGLGVFSATFRYSQQADRILLTVINSKLLKNKKSSNNYYFSDSGRLTIPLLAVQQSTTGEQYYSVTLERVDDVKQLQFKVTAIELVNL